MKFPPPRMRALAALKVGESVIFQAKCRENTDAQAQGAASKLGARITTQRCYLQDHESLTLIPVCVVTLVKAGRQLLPRGRPRKEET